MSDIFDPYHKWLAIPPEEQPANHYRLLGVRVFEDDADVIESSADRQMGHVRRYASGQRGELSQKILNEISAAKVCLLNPAKRTAYDAALRAQQQAAAPVAAKVLPMAQALPSAQAVPQATRVGSPQLRTRDDNASAGQQMGGMDIPLVGSSSGGGVKRRKKKSSPVLAIVGLLAVAAVVIGVAAVVLKKPEPGKQNTVIAQENKQPDQTTPHQGHNSVTIKTPPAIPDRPDLTARPEVTDGEQTPGGSTESTTPGGVAGKPVNLFAGFDLAEDVINGEGWGYGDGALTIPAGESPVRIQSAAAMPNEYQLALTVERISGDAGFYLGLPFAGGELGCFVDGKFGNSTNEFATGFYSSDGTSLASLRRSSELLKQNQEVKISCYVRQGAIQLLVGGQRVATWQPNGQEVQAAAAWAARDAKRLVVGGDRSSFKITQLMMLPLNQPNTVASSENPAEDGSSGTGSSTTTVTKALGKAVDLLTGLELEKAVVAGEPWSLEDGVLSVPEAPPKPAVRLQFPKEMPSEYVLSMIVERTSEGGHFALGLPCSSGFVYCPMDLTFKQPEGKPLSGFHDGTTAKDLATQVGTRVLPLNEPVQVEVQVRDDALTLTANGRLIARWKSDSRRMGQIKYWEVPVNNRLMLGSFEGSFKVSRLEFKPFEAVRIAGTQPGTVVDTDKLVGEFGETILDGDDPASMDNEGPLTNNPGSGSSRPSGLGQKQAPPTAEKQAETLVVIKDLFPDDYAAAKTPATKLELGKKLIETARSTKDDPVALYVLLTEAINYAGEGGDAAVPMQALDMLDRAFAVDLVALYVGAFEKILKGARQPEEHQALLSQIKPGIQAAIQADRYEEADKLMKIAQSSARVTKDIAVVKEVAAAAKQLRDAQAAFDKVKLAKAKLAQDPANPEACTEWGRYLCLVKNDFTQGLPLLVKGSDAKLQAAAKQDLAEPRESKDQIALGDKWFALADGATGTEQALLRLRAENWYRRGVQDLTGLEKTRIDKRLKDIAAIDRSSLPRAPGGTSVGGGSSSSSGPISLVGRCEVNGQDIGVTFTYRMGTVINGGALREHLAKYNVSADARIRIRLTGWFVLRQETNLALRLAGGSSSGGVCYLSIDGRRISSVGDDRNKDSRETRMFGAGEHLVLLEITGGDLGSCVMECTQAEDNGPVRFVVDPALALLRNLPTQATLDISELE